MHNLRVGLLAALGAMLSACVSPSITLKPAAPAPAVSSAGPGVAVRLEVGDSSSRSRFEESGDKWLIGTSESLGVHLSDFWLAEPPARLVQRLVEADVNAWGHRVVPNGEQVQVRGQVNRVALNSRAINAFEFQADGVIDVVLRVVPKGTGREYRQQYVATCTFRSATSIPDQENMEHTFNQCVKEFQKRIAEDRALNAALAGS